jgi:transposase InsO family protein
VHANAKLNVHGRRLLIERILAGRPIAHVAAELGVSRQTATRWWDRWRHEGDAGLWERSSRPHRSPTRTQRSAERRIEALRRRSKLGPARIAGILELNPATVHRVLVRLGLNRLRWLDRPTGQVIRRIPTQRPGELVHVDIKKLGRIPTGGGWRAHGRGNVAHQRVGYAYVHSAVDAHSRVAYSEVLDDERAHTAIGFTHRAVDFFAGIGVGVERILTDNGSCYRAGEFSRTLTDAGIRHTRTRPRRPQTNGKVERFNRTLLDEWAYVRVYRTETARRAALARWLHLYNHHRAHTALGGHPPMSRVTNVTGEHT